MNIPVYRAKKIDGGEYAEGYFQPNFNSTLFFIRDNHSNSREIDPTTLAIQFPFFFIEGLFFGLDNGKGASLIEAKFKSDNSLFKGVAICDSNGHVFYDKNDDWVSIDKLKDIKVVDINL